MRRKYIATAMRTKGSNAAKPPAEPDEFAANRVKNMRSPWSWRDGPWKEKCEDRA
jgi:hypothetical protein